MTAGNVNPNTGDVGTRNPRYRWTRKGADLSPRLFLSNVSWLVVRSISTAYPQGRFLGCVSVHMGLLRNRSQGREKPAGVNRRACGYLLPLPPQPPCVRGDPLPVAVVVV
jgi:hypothetical protein